MEVVIGTGRVTWYIFKGVGRVEEMKEEDEDKETTEEGGDTGLHIRQPYY